VGVDTGGTFTDFIVMGEGKRGVFKIPSTPRAPEEAILKGLDQVVAARDVGTGALELVHGTTVATNALLERRGARTALLTTAGFRDVLAIGRQNRPQLYSLSPQRPPTLVPDERRFEVEERLDAQGMMVRPLDEAALAPLANALRASGAESLAVVFLFSFLNPVHEQAAAAILRGLLPELPISLSSKILSEYREYERTSTTVINAYVQPLVARYLARLATALAGRRAQGEGRDSAATPASGDAASPAPRAPRPAIRIMQSNGGVIGLHQAAEQAARVVLSGPAGGVVGAFEVARQAQISLSPCLPGSLSANTRRQGDKEINLLTFDMGGTSTDVCLCPDRIPTTAESTITGLPLRLPVIDIHTVGAGGGSIAFVDTGGALQVGPRSAGAVPGPVCYGRGGWEPTVTDANLLLGRLDPAGFLGGHGAVQLDTAAARRALQALGARIGLTAEAAALGIVRVANATMERALRTVSVEQGYDPRNFTLLPFGGAGPLHACDLAAALGIRRILCPPIPGVLSAYGMLVAEVTRDASQSLLVRVEALKQNLAPLEALSGSLAGRVQRELALEGVAAPQLEAALDLRYCGQSYELTVPLPLPVAPAGLARAVEEFHAAHAQRYGYAMHGERVECVTVRVRARAPGARLRLPEQAPAGEAPSAAFLFQKDVWFAGAHAVPAACYNRSKLAPGNRFAGPALVFQYDSTVVVAPGWQVAVDRIGNLWLEQLVTS